MFHYSFVIPFYFIRYNITYRVGFLHLLTLNKPLKHLPIRISPSLSRHPVPSRRSVCYLHSSLTIHLSSPYYLFYSLLFPTSSTSILSREPSIWLSLYSMLSPSIEAARIGTASASLLAPPPSSTDFLLQRAGEVCLLTLLFSRHGIH